MMLTIHGLPTSTNYQELKRIIKQECNITDFILDSLVMDDDGCKKVRIGVTDDGDGSHLMKYLHGYRYAGHILRIVPVGKPNLQNQGNFAARGNYQQRNDYQANNFGGRPMQDGPPRSNWGPGGQWGQGGAPPVQQGPFPNQQVQPVINNNFPHQPQTRGFAPGAVPPVQQNFGYTVKNNVPDHPVTIMKDNFQGPNQFHHQPGSSGHFQSQPHGQQAPWTSQTPAKPQTFDKSAAGGYNQMGFNDNRPGPKQGPDGGYKDYDKGDRRFPPQREASPGRHRISPGRRMSPVPGRRLSPGRRMSPTRPGVPNRGMSPSHGRKLSPQGRRISPGPYRRGSPGPHRVSPGPHRDRVSPHGGPARRLSPVRRDSPPGRRMSPDRCPPSPRRRSPPMDPSAGMRGSNEDNEEIVEGSENDAAVSDREEKEEDSKETDSKENDSKEKDINKEPTKPKRQRVVAFNKKGKKLPHKYVTEKDDPFYNPELKALYNSLSGAGRKRCRAMMADNVPVEIAVEMSQKRWSQLPPDMNPRKRKRIIRQTLKLKQEMAVKYPPLPPPFDSAPTFNPAPPVIFKGISKKGTEVKTISQVCIQNVKHMTAEQAKILRQHLISKILQLPKGEGPRFEDYSYKGGVLTVTCRDKQSQLWLHSEASHIEPWPEAKLSVSMVRVPSTPAFVHVLLPDSETTDVGQALSMFKVQNRGLNTEEWVVTSARPVARGIHLALTIDGRSARALKETNFKVCLGFKTLTFQLGYTT